MSCLSLRHLALDGYVYIDPAEIIDSIRTLAPSLTHSFLSREPAGLEPRLKELVDQPIPSVGKGGQGFLIPMGPTRFRFGWLNDNAEGSKTLK